MIAAKRFRYQRKWIEVGAPVSMSPADERAHRILGLIEDGPAQPELTVPIYCDRYMAGEGRDDPAMLQFAVNNGEAIEAEFTRRQKAAQAPAKPKQTRRKKK